MADATRYRFGPLERRGVLLGLRPSQLVILGGGSLLMVASLRLLAAPAGWLVALVIVVSATAVAFVPVAGRTLDQWLPTLWASGYRAVTGRNRFRATRFASNEDGSGGVDLPPSLTGIELLGYEIPGSGARIGIIKDRGSGTFTGALAVRGRSFALLDHPEKERRLAQWGGILSDLAREGSIVARVQWVERALPDPGDEIGSHLKTNLAVPLDSPIARSYLEVIDEAGPSSQKHESFVVLQITAARCGRAIRAAGGGDDGACTILARELSSLSSRLLGCEVKVQGALTPRLYAQALRDGFDPSSRDLLARVAAHDQARTGTSSDNARPLASDVMWSSYRCDATWHRSYWIAEWPRLDVEADFLAPLLLRTERVRTVAVTMEPISPLKAVRSIEAARTSAAADEELRHRAGFATTLRRVREQDSLADHERDLSRGHALYRFAGFITVSAGEPEELDAACAEIEEAAARALLDLRSLDGQQDAAFTYTLPLGRGLR